MPPYAIYSDSGVCSAYVTSVAGCSAAAAELGLSDVTAEATSQPSSHLGCIQKYDGADDVALLFNTEHGSANGQKFNDPDDRQCGRGGVATIGVVGILVSF